MIYKLPRDSLTSFTTVCFLIPQGTGILAIVLHQLPYQFHGLETISIIFWLINIVLLAVFLTIFLVRLLTSPLSTIKSITTSTVETACLASISIAFMSAIQMLSLVVIPSWGHGWSLPVYILWWINCFLAVLACIGIPNIFVTSIPHEGGFTRALTPATQLPIIAALTSAAGAGTLCQSAMLSTAQKVPMIVVAYLEIGLALPLSLVFDALYLARILQPWGQVTGENHEFPPEQIYSHMVLCGPWGQSSFALQSLGRAVYQLGGKLGGEGEVVLFGDRGTETVAFASMLIGLVNWGQGTFWWAFAVISIVRDVVGRLRRKREVAFHLPSWAMVFPWGVYSNSAIQLGQILPSAAFKIWSTVLVVCLVVIWFGCSGFTLYNLVVRRRRRTNDRRSR